MVDSAAGVPASLALPCRLPKPTLRRRAVCAQSAYLQRTPCTSPTRWPRTTGSAQRRADDDPLDERLARRAPSGRPRRAATSLIGARPYPVSARPYARRLSIAVTRWYCASPQASSPPRSAFRWASVGEPSTDAVMRTPSPCDGGHLRPAGVVRVTRLGADQRQRADQVVGRGQRATAGDRRGRPRRPRADERVAERRRQEGRHVARARDVTRLVEPVRVLEVRRGEPELPSPSRSSARRTAGSSPSPTYAARAVAASFALGTSAAIARSCTVSLSPARRLTLDSPTRAARGDTVTTSERRACSSATSTVISLVMLAGARATSGERAARTTASGPPRTM